MPNHEQLAKSQTVPASRNEDLQPQDDITTNRLGAQSAKMFARLPKVSSHSLLREHTILGNQQLLGNKAVQRLLDHHRSASTTLFSQVPPVQGLPVQRKQENEAALAAIQGYPMFSLLPKLQSLPPEVRSDEAAGNAVGGPRLVTAIRVIQAKGASSWLDFATAHNGDLASLPADQIADIMHFLGAPKDARYYKADQFDGRFDGAVDPIKGVITLFFRVRFEVENARFGAAQAGTPQWEKETKEGLKKFKADYKRVIEDTWSNKGAVHPACRVGAIQAFQTKVVVTDVDSGEHALIHLFADTPGGRSNMDREGALQISDNEEKTRTRTVVDPTGRRPEQVTNTQITSAHEFGHAIGVGQKHHRQHVHCDSGDDNCYGVTAEERQDIMGAGHQLQVVKIDGKVTHDDFEAFERIGERWGQEIFPGSLVKCNKWSAG